MEKLKIYFIQIFLIFFMLCSQIFSQAKFEKHIIDNNFDRAAGIHANDIDSDGDADIVCAGVNAGIAWWRNDGGKPATWTKQIIDLNINGPMSSYAIDVDSDGDTDVLAAAWYGSEIVWYRNEGDDPIVWTKQIPDDF